MQTLRPTFRKIECFMVDENNRAPSEPARSESAAGADPSAPVNGLPPAASDRVAPGPPPVPPGEQVRAAGAAPPPAAAPARGKEKGKDSPPEIKDGFREIVETVVFVVVLVLLLKAFLAEAFVIPTGSMATTLYGYHRNVTCPQCGYQFPINVSDQYDRDRPPPYPEITGCTCPNCFHPFNVVPNVPEARQP
jgi:hypothetical protein